MLRSRNVCLVALGCTLLACDPTEPSDEGQYQLAIRLADQLNTNSHRVLVGSTFSVRVESVTDSEVDHDGCVTQSASGVLTPIGLDEYSVDALGPGAVELAAPSLACPERDDILAELGPDRWSMIGVDPSAAIGKWLATSDSAVLGSELVPGPAQAFPDEFGRPLDELRVVGEYPFEAAPVLIEPSVSARAELRWGDPNASLEVPDRYRSLATVITDEGYSVVRTTLAGSMHADESFASSLLVAGHELALPEVRAVPVTQVATLELVTAYSVSDATEREWGPPLGVVAIARDDQGRRILGAPLQWSVTRGRLFTELMAASGDAIMVADCRDAPKKPGWREATVEATLDDVVASVDLEWVALPSDDVIDPIDARCAGTACDCSTAESPRGGVLAMLALFGLGGLLRRVRDDPDHV